MAKSYFIFLCLDHGWCFERPVVAVIELRIGSCMLFGNVSDIFLGCSFLSFGDRIGEGECCCLQIQYFIYFICFYVKCQEPKCVFSLFYTCTNVYVQPNLFKYDTQCLRAVFCPCSLYVWLS